LKKLLFITVIVTILVIILVYLNQTFIFNPFSFKKDSVTTYDWSFYRYPSTIEYLSRSDTEGWVLENTVTNKKEIKNIFMVLKSELELNGLSRKEYDEAASGRAMEVVIRRSDGVIMRNFYYYEDSNIADLGNGVFIELPTELKELLLKRTFN
jgi:hypothetical protein